MVTKYDTSFSSPSGKSSMTTILLIGAALVVGYFAYQRFFAKPKEERQPQ
jgi:cytochrome bd-type quinol oxidase subunit 2